MIPAGLHRLLDRASMALIGAGLVMLTQPFFLELYRWSFTTILVGTVLFMVVGKLPVRRAPQMEG